MAAQFPAAQNMVTFQHGHDDVALKESFIFAKRHYGATDADIGIDKIANAKDWKYGDCLYFRLEWYTYKGWKVYMLMTGCFASDPLYEKKAA